MKQIFIDISKFFVTSCITQHSNPGGTAIQAAALPLIASSNAARRGGQDL